MQSLSNIITDREMLDFSQHFDVTRNYAGSRLFPDAKTEYVEQEYLRTCENGNLPMMAQIHAFDTEAVIGNRVPFEKVDVEELLIKEKVNLTESLRRYTRGMGMAEDRIRAFIFDDVARTAERVVSRAELAKMDALARGGMTIAGNGMKTTIDFGVPGENKVSSDWTKADADILGDLRKWRDIAAEHGTLPNRAMCSGPVMTRIMGNAAVQKAIFGASGTGILPTIDQVNNLLMGQVGITVEVNEARYGEVTTSGDDVKVKQHRFFPKNAFVMFAVSIDGTVGTGLWGVTPEEDEQTGAWDSMRAQQFVTVVQWTEHDPVAHWTKASGLFVPVIPNPYGHIIANVGGGDLDG